MSFTDDPSSGLSESDGDQAVDAIIEEFLWGLERGNKPEIHDFLARYPDQATELAKLLPTVTALAKLRSLPDDWKTAVSTPPANVDTPLTPLGDFRLIREIGRGGMGIVYEAEQLSLARRVAVKVLPFAGHFDSRQLQRFKNEARAAATLNHPHIVGVYAVGQERGVHFYAMELIEGQSLAEVIADWRSFAGSEIAMPCPVVETKENRRVATNRVNPVSTASEVRTARHRFRQIAQWGIQAADALDHAHQMGIVHRDVKPSNLLVNSEGNVWVTDFGVAMTNSDVEVTLTGDLLGTLRYMSPEQVLGQRRVIDHRSDVYSLGVTLYELLGLRPAFPAADRAALMRQIESEDASLLPLRAQSVPSELITIIYKAMNKDVEDRYTTAGEMSDDLQRYLDDRPIRARSPSLIDRLRKWVKRHRTLSMTLLLSGSLVMLTATVSAALVWRAQYQTEIERLARQSEQIASEVTRKILREHQYFTSINRADLALRRHQMTDAITHLEECLPKETEADPRGFEWWYLSTQTEFHDAIQKIGSNDGKAHMVKASPDGNRVLSCGDDGVRVWDAKTNRCLGVFNGHNTYVNSIEFSPDGQFLVSSSNDCKSLVWETNSWKSVANLPHSGQSHFARFSSDGQFVVTGERREKMDGIERGRNVVRVWETSTWKEIAVLDAHHNRPAIGDLDDTGRWLITGDREGVVNIANLSDHSIQKTIRPFEDIEEFGREVEDVDIAHRHPWFALASRSLVRIQNVEDGSLVANLPFTQTRCCGIQFSPDDTYLIAVGEGELKSGSVVVWEQSTVNDEYQLLDQLSFPKCVSHVSFFAQDEVLLSSTDGAIYRWRLPYRRQERRIRSNVQGMIAVAVSPDGRFLACTGDRLEVRSLNDPDRSIVLDANGNGSVAFSPDGRFLVREILGVCMFWNAENWEVAAVIPARPDVRFPETVRRLKFVDGSRRMQLKFVLGPPIYWDLPTAMWPRQTDTQNLSLAKWPATVRWAEEDAPGIYEVHHRSDVLWRKRIQNVRTFELSPDGAIFAAGLNDGVIDLFDAETGTRTTSCFGTGEAIVGLEFSPNQRVLASFGNSGSCVTLWQISTGRAFLTINPRLREIHSVCFTPDERRLVVSGQNETSHGEVVILNSWADGALPDAFRDASSIDIR